jgi:glycosyltransferase involved in cell wall biosynthesis
LPSTGKLYFPDGSCGKLIVKIWFIQHYALPLTEGGSTRHYSYARELIRRGHEVEIVACSFQHAKREQMPMSPGKTWERRICDGVPFTWIRACGYRRNSPLRVLNMLQFGYRAWRREWAKGLPEPDLIVGMSPQPFSALAGERIAAHFDVPFVLEIADAWPHVLIEVGGYSRWHPFVQLVDRTMRHLYRRAARISIYSRFSTGLLARYGADPSKIVAIPMGVDLEVHPAPRPAPEDGQFVVSYFGAHNQWNSLDVVLDAAKLIQQAGLKEVLFRFVGDGISKPGLIERVKKEGINNVRFDDPVPKREIPALAHTSDAFIINSRNDGASKEWMSYNKVYDYLAAGRPIVFGCCSQENPVRDAGAGISVEADNAAELARAVTLLAGQPPQALWEYGLRGRRFIEDNYSITKLVDRFEQMATEVTGQAHSLKASPSGRSQVSLAGE